MTRPDPINSLLPPGTSTAYAGGGWGRRLSMLAAIAGLYFLAARFGFMMAFATAQVSAVWPPTGLAAVLYVLYGWRIWPGVFAGAFAINAVSNEPLFTAAAIAVGNTAAGLAGLALMRRFTKADTHLHTVPSVLGWAVFVAAAGCLVSASNGVVQLGLAGIVPWAATPGVWVIWWVGDTMGVLLFGSFLLVWLSRSPSAAGRRQARGWPYRLERLLALLLLTVLCHVAMGGLHWHAAESLRLEYAVFPLMIWLGLRHSQRAVATGVMLVCGFAIWGTIHGQGPFASQALDRSLVQLELFMAITAITGLTLGAATSQRRAAEQALQRALDETEHRVTERTHDLAQAHQALAERHAQLALEAAERARQQARIEAALREKETLLKEVYHRVKNNMQVVLSLLNLQLHGIRDPATRDIISDAERRIRAMNLVHEMAYQSANVAAIPLDTYVHELFTLTAKSGERERRDAPAPVTLSVAIDPMHIELEQAVPLGLLLTELIANSLDHAFGQRAGGRLHIALHRQGPHTQLVVEDDGVGLPAGFDLGRMGGGGLSIAGVLARQLGGHLKIGDADVGTRLEASLNLKAAAPMSSPEATSATHA